MSVQVSGRIVPRDVTDDEARFFRENGWVKLEQLISEEEAAVMLARLSEIMGADATTAAHPALPDNPKQHITYFHTYEPLAIELGSGDCVDELFYGFSHSPELGRVGAKLGGGPVRYWVDGALVKMPVASDTGSDPTHWHSDVGAVDRSPFDPPHGQMQLWVALAEVTPERGMMRFVAPKDLDDEVRELTAEHAADPVASYAQLEAKGVLSPPLTMRPGDATVHASATMHSAPTNTSDAPRWAYMCSLFPASAVFSGNQHWALQGVESVETGRAFPERRFPVLTA
jgi:hypothetical protein